MTGESLGMAFRASSLRFQSSFSVVSSWFVGSKKTVSSCAMPVDSMFTSIGVVGISSLIFKIIFSLGSISNRDKKSAAVFIFPGMCAIVKLNCSTKSHAFHRGGGIIFVWKNLVSDLPCHDNHWFGGTPKYMSKFFESHVNG